MKVPDSIVWVVGSNPTDGQLKMLTVEEVETGKRLHAYGFYDGHQWRYPNAEKCPIEINPTSGRRMASVVAWAELPVIPRFEGCEPVPIQNRIIQSVEWRTSGKPDNFRNVNVTLEDKEKGDRKQSRAYWNDHQWRYTSTDNLVEEDDRPYRVVAWAEEIILQPLEEHACRVTFGQAIEALKLGHKVTRAGWNEKGAYLWLLPAAVVKAEWCREPHLKEVAEANGGEIECLGSIRMYTVNASGRKAVLTGWLASQTDVLAEDWRIVE